MRIHIARLVWGLLLIIAPIPIDAQATRTTVICGFELSSFRGDPEFEDPYGVPAGGGIAADFRFPFSHGALLVQARVSGWGFPSLNEAFSQSFMVHVSLGAGWCLCTDLSYGARVEILPFLRAGQYARQYLFFSQPQRASRPTLSVGAELRLRTDSGMVLGMGAMDLVLFEQSTRHFAHWFASAGWELPMGQPR